MSALLDALLAKPTTAGARPQGRRTVEADFTSQIEVSGDTASVTLRDEPGKITDGTAFAFLEEEGLTPSEWEIASFKKSKWGSAEKPMDSVSFTFRRRLPTEAERPNIDEIIDLVMDEEPLDPAAKEVIDDDSVFVVALGDMQFGKIDGDGVEGALRRTVECLEKAADKFARSNCDYAHIAWLGDHVEGFVSQGGANTWRTPLTLSEQIRLTRRVMLHAMRLFAPMCSRVTMVAVPGNHGEPQRFSGKGVTRYDDSHDTESLIAIADAAKLNAAAFSHVEFYVPETDEMTVVLELGGAVVGHVHGHQWRPGKQFDWWQGQAFNSSSPLGAASILFAGHLHHEHIERQQDGRLYIGVPSLESESTWWRHSTGQGGRPGIITGIIRNGEMESIEFIKGEK